VTAVIAGRWAANYSPFSPFIVGYGLRLVVSTEQNALLLRTESYALGICNKDIFV
jgi:hypothetical protein